MKTISVFIVTLFIFSCTNKQGDESASSKIINNRSPLIQKPFMELPLGAIRPEGWLYEQLLRQKSGMTGNLDTIYSHVMGKRNGWLGGDGHKTTTKFHDYTCRYRLDFWSAYRISLLYFEYAPGMTEIYTEPMVCHPR